MKLIVDIHFPDNLTVTPEEIRQGAESGVRQVLAADWQRSRSRALRRGPLSQAAKKRRRKASQAATITFHEPLSV